MRRFLIDPLLLAACGSLVPSTVARLSQLSPMEADPADIEVAVAFPPGLDVQAGGAVLVLTATRTDTGQTSGGRYVLDRREGVPAEVPADPGGQVAVFRVAPRDLPALSAQQALIRTWEAENDPATSGSLSVSLAGCARGEGPAPDADGAVWMRVEAGGGFLPLVRPTAIAAILDGATIAALPACP